ncbi:hypothetical protein [Agrococcus versicolor]
MGEQWLLLVVVAAVVLAAGVALAVSGRARRSVLTGLGALAIVGALVVGGIGGAPSAQADAGSADCVTAPMRPAPAAAAIVVTPGIPTTTVQCAAEPTLQVPTTTGVVYSQTRTGSSVTVTAAAAPGYALLAGAVTSWTYDLTPTTRAPWPVTLPATTQATLLVDFSNQSDTYPMDPADPVLVPSLQAAQDAGALTYALDGSGYTESQQFGVFDGETDEQLATGTVRITYPVDLAYDFAENQYLLTFIGEPEDLDAQYDAQLDALTAPFPGSYARPVADFPPAIEITGLEIDASYEPGPGCATETAVVALEADVEFVLPPVLDREGVDALGRALPDSATAFGEPAQTLTEDEGTQESALTDQSAPVEGPAVTDGSDASDASDATDAPDAEEPTVDESIVVVEP